LYTGKATEEKEARLLVGLDVIGGSDGPEVTFFVGPPRVVWTNGLRCFYLQICQSRSPDLVLSVATDWNHCCNGKVR
jgi:hypothetical protein